MKCLVTGASGFIGSHLVKALEARGDEVMELPRQCLYDPLALEGDLSFNPDYIFHLAAYGNMSDQKDLDMIFQANLIGTYNLLTTTKDIPYKAFINVSSSSVLLNHETMYSATKAGAERLCKAFVDEYNKPIVSVRPYSVYGPGEAEFRFIPTVFRSCIKGETMTLDPSPIHDWVYIDDMVTCLLNVADKVDDLKGESVNFGTGFGTSNSMIVELIEEITEKKANIGNLMTMRSYDNSKWVAGPTGKYMAKTDIREGLEKYYEWYMGRSK